MMANITADHLLEALRVSGFVVMTKPPATGFSVGASPEYEASLRAKKRLTE